LENNQPNKKAAIQSGFLLYSGAEGSRTPVQEKSHIRASTV